MLSAVKSFLLFIANLMGFLRDEQLRKDGATQVTADNHAKALEVGEDAVRMEKSIRKSPDPDLVDRL